MYAAARRMSTMVLGLNTGLLKSARGITCFTCHRGGPNHALHPLGINRQTVQNTMTAWPAGASGGDDVRRVMSAYNVSLGVECVYCHVPGNWKADQKPAMRTTHEMIALMSEFPKYFDFANASAFTCFTCHQGAVKVAR
jgi:hypothetical protein